MTFNQTNKGVRIINKDTKMIILYFLILAISLGKIYMVLDGFQKEYELLLVEVNQLESQKQELTEEKRKLIKYKQSLEGKLKGIEEENQFLLDKVDFLEEENENLRTIRAKLTAYSPLDNVDGQQAEGNPTRTSIGKKVSRGIVAADPRKLPYGTKLEIPNWGVVEVGDTGGALRSDNKNIRIDLFHLTYPEAMKFGVKDLEVKILEWGDKSNEK